MFRSTFKMLAIVAVSAAFGGALTLARLAHADTGDVVDLNGDTHHNPPASTTDKSTPAPGTTPDVAKPVTKEDKDSQDAAKTDAAAEKLKLRAGERAGNGPRGSAQVLGMSLQEGTHERAKVIDVAMNSPAFDAGVIKGDEILAFQGFRGESYAKWIDGIRRLTTDTGAGLKIPVVVARDGKQVTVRIAVPERIVRSSNPRPLAQPGSPLIPPGVAPALPASGGPGAPVAVNGGNNVVVDNGGPFGEFFGGEAASANERAMAQIVRIGGQLTPASNPVADAAAAGNIRNNQTAGQNTTDTPTAAPIQGGARIGLAGFRDDPSGMVVMVDVGALPPGNYTVGIGDPGVIGGAAVTGTGAVNPNIQTPSQAASPQSPVPAPNKGGSVDAVPPTGDLQPPNAPAAGKLGPTPTPQGAKDAGNVGSATLNHIGTITVDQTGTGRMQQKVESAQVRNIVGQAIVLYSQGSSPQTASSAPGVQGSTASQTAQPVTGGTQVPVAGGIIQLVTDRRPPAAAGPQTLQTPAGANGAVEQPANATAPTGQNLVR